MEEDIISQKEKYYSFRNELEKKVSNKLISTYNHGCYLIKESWIEEFIKLSENAQLPKKNPEILGDISSIVNCLKNKAILKLVNQELMEFVFKDSKDELIRNKCFYYTGKNKLIIEYTLKNEMNGILLVEPFTGNKKIYILKTSNERNNIKIYYNILNYFEPHLLHNEDYKKNIIDFEDFINDKEINQKYKQRKEEFLTNNMENGSETFKMTHPKKGKHPENSEFFNNNLTNKYSIFFENGLNIIKQSISSSKNVDQNSDYTNYKNKEKIGNHSNSKERKFFRTKYDKKYNICENKEQNIKINIENKNRNIEKEIGNSINESNKSLLNSLNEDKEEYSKIKQENNNRESEKGVKEKQLQSRQLIPNINMPEISQNIIQPLKKNDAPTLIGLNNIGATIFMNSILQCLSQTKELTKYFLNKKNENHIINNNLALKDRKSLQLCPVYLSLIHELWSKTSKRSISPYKFWETVERINPLFKSGQPGDSKDFIIFILEQLHEELKMTLKYETTEKKPPLNQYDMRSTLNYFIEEFKKQKSIISDIFFGTLETTNICLNCKEVYNSNGLQNPICYNYQIFYCLNFPLEEVKNMKNNLMSKNNYLEMINTNNCVSLYDCFYYNQKSEFFTGENQNYCANCKQLCDSVTTSRIFISPNVLILILNRGKSNIYDVKLNFEEIIDITNFVLQSEFPKIIYELYGVVSHIGQGGPNAHFVASCKSPIDNRWYRYNDSIVNPINNFQEEIIDYGTPYILFYQKNTNYNSENTNNNQNNQDNKKEKENKIVNIKKGNSIFNNELDDIYNQVVESKKENQKEERYLVKHNSDLNSNLEEVYKQNNLLIKENNKLKNTEKENANKINILIQENNNLKIDISKLNDIYKENAELKEKYNILKHNEKDYIQDEKIYKNMIQKESELCKKEEELNKKEEDLNEKMNSIKNYKKSLAKEKEDTNIIKQENMDLMKKNKELEEQIKELNKLISEKNSRLNDINKQNKESNEKNKEFKNIEKEYENKEIDLKKQIIIIWDKYEKIINEKDDDLNSKEEKIVKLNDEIKYKENELKMMQIKQEKNDKIQQEKYENLMDKNKNEIKELTDKIISMKEQLELKLNQNNELTKNIDSLNIKIKENKQNIIDKDNKIKNLQNELNNVNINNYNDQNTIRATNDSNREKMISIILKTEDENILYSIICRDNQKFEDVINIFKRDNPECTNFNCFLNGKEINEKLTLKENKINHNNIIIIK